MNIKFNKIQKLARCIMQMLLKPVGIIHSPFKERKDSPHQGRYGDQTSEIHIFDEYVDALEGIEKYKNLIILY